MTDFLCALAGTKIPFRTLFATPGLAITTRNSWCYLFADLWKNSFQYECVARKNSSVCPAMLAGWRAWDKTRDECGTAPGSREAQKLPCHLAV